MDEGVIAVTEHDVSVDALVSPAGVIPIGTTAIDRYHYEFSLSFFFPTVFCVQTRTTDYFLSNSFYLCRMKL